MVVGNSSRRTASYIAAVIGLAALIGLQLTSNSNVDEKYENVLRQLKAELDEATADDTTGMKKKQQFINHRITVDDKINEDVDDVDSVISLKKRKLEDGKFFIFLIHKMCAQLYVLHSLPFTINLTTQSRR